MSRRLRTVSYLTAVMLAFGMAHLFEVSANAKDPVFPADSYPRVDGSYSAQALAIGFQRAFTGEDPADLVFHSADEAYANLIDGDADLILATAPSEKNQAEARQAGVEFQTIPVASEPLFFLTSTDNPVDSLTVNQLRDIYSGVITDWSQVGGRPGPITAYQRTPDSGSQSAMQDLVMKGTPMMNAPTQSVRWMGQTTTVVASFSPDESAVGYANYYYVASIWPELARTGEADGIKVLQVDGISPVPGAERVQPYPLTAAYTIVMKKSEPKNSQTRALAEAMVSAHGQGVVQEAGYLPVGPTDLPPQSVTPTQTPEDPHGLADEGQIYAVNPITVSATTEYVVAVSGATVHCASVDRVIVQGLANPATQSKLMSEFRSRQDTFLKTLWGVNRLTSQQSCEGSPELTLGMLVEANFANVISLVSTWGAPEHVDAHDPAATLNLRLDTGQELSFADVFTVGTNVADLIQAEALASDPQADEQQVLSWVEEYAAQPDLPFSFSATSATIYLPGASNGEKTGVTVSYSSRWQNLAIVNLASAATGLYLSAGPQQTCPVLTFPDSGYCWSAEPDLAAAQVPYSGQSLTFPVGEDIQDEWRILYYSDGFVAAPSPASGKGPSEVKLEVSENTSADPRTLTVSFQVTNPATLQAHQGRITIAQAGRTAPSAPTIITATDTILAGATQMGTTLVVTWPDGSLTQVTPSADGDWSTLIPPGMTSGLALVMAQDLAGNPSELTRTMLELTEQTRPGVGQAVVDPAHSVLSITSAPIQVVTDPCSKQTTTSPDTLTASVAVVNTEGEPMPEAVVAFSTTDGMMLAQQYVTADEHGVATVVALMDQSALLGGAVPVLSATIMVNGEKIPVSGSGIEVPVAVSFPPAPQTVPMVTISPTTGPLVPADNFSTYRVSVEWIDGCEVPVAGQLVQFIADGSAHLSATSVELDADGRAQILVTDPVAQTVSLQALILDQSGDPVDVHGLTQMVFAPAVPDPIQSAASAADALVSIPCDAPGATTVTAMVKDENGHPLYQQEVYFEATGNAMISPSVATTDERGQATVSLTDEVSETVTVSVSVGPGQEVTGAPMLVNFASICALPTSASIWFSVSPGPKVADGTEAYTVTIYAKDVNGGPVKGVADSFSLTETTGTVGISHVVDQGDGTYTSQVTSSQAGTFEVRVRMNQMDLASGPASLNFLPAWSTTLKASLDTDPVATPSALVANDHDAYLITAELFARMGKSAPAPLAGQASLMSVSVRGADGDPGGATVADLVETQPGVYTGAVTASVPGDYDVVVSWAEPGEAPVTSQELPVTFLAPQAGTEVTVATGGHHASPTAAIWAVSAAFLLTAGAVGIRRFT